MKNKNFSLKPMLAAFALLLTANMAFAQSREKRDVSDFDALSVSSAFVVEISVGKTESLEIEADDRYIDEVITEVRGGTLIIRMEESRGRRRMDKSPRAYLTVKSLNKIRASGASHIKALDILEAKRLEVDLSGASVVSLEIETEDFYMEASGACTMNIQGSTENQYLKSSGASVYRAYDLESKTADIRVNGAGSVKVSVSDELDVRASGASSVRYKGSPRVDSNTSGASSVKRG